MQSLLLQSGLSTAFYPAGQADRWITCCFITVFPMWRVTAPITPSPDTYTHPSPVTRIQFATVLKHRKLQMFSFFFSSFFPPLNPPFPSLLVCNSWWAFALSLCENRQALRCGKHRYSDLAWLLCKGSSLIFNSPGSWAIIHPKAAWLTFSEVFWCLTVVPLIKSFVQKAKLKGVPEDTRISCFPSASQLFIKGSRGLEWNI